MIIAAFDLATVTGVAYGPASDIGPAHTETWDLSGIERNDKWIRLSRVIESFLLSRPIDQIWFEEPMNAAIAMYRGSSSGAMQLLVGMAAVLCVEAGHRDIPINSVGVNEARQSLLGYRPKKGQGKAEVRRLCHTLRWPAENLDEADACAIWWYAARRVNPKIAHLATPLFIR